MGVSDVLPAPDGGDPIRPGLPCHLLAPIRRAGVHDDYLEVLIVPVLQGAKAVCQMVSAVSGRNEDGDERVLIANCAFPFILPAAAVHPDPLRLRRAEIVRVGREEIEAGLLKNPHHDRLVMAKLREVRPAAENPKPRIGSVRERVKPQLSKA